MHIVDLCRDPYGALTDTRKALLKQLLNAPNRCTWERARGLIINDVPLVTLEAAVSKVRRKDDANRTPDPFTLYRALRFAVDYESGEAESDCGGICR